MLKHIIKKARIAPELAPINMDRFGNVSSASIPLLMVDQLASLRERRMEVAMFGFGVGYSWAAGLLAIGPLAVCKLIEVV
jgi:3-oxoacyl-[acyl-carrier-protein] synthase-3